jgi:hypothetical protein
MDQQEWAVSEDPLAILAAVGETLGDHPDRSFYRQAPVEASERKLRLFACACARAVWDKLGEPRTRLAVEVAERVADGLLGSVDRGKAFNAAENIPSPTQGYVAEACLRADAAEGAADIVGAIREWLPTMPSILHDLFGNPFAPVTHRQALHLLQGEEGAARPLPVDNAPGAATGRGGVPRQAGAEVRPVQGHGAGAQLHSSWRRRQRHDVLGRPVPGLQPAAERHRRHRPRRGRHAGPADAVRRG